MTYILVGPGCVARSLSAASSLTFCRNVMNTARLPMYITGFRRRGICVLNLQLNPALAPERLMP
jgi:hypothetical protein